MEAILQYYAAVAERLDRIMKEQREPMEKAAALIAEHVMAGRIYHIFGTGGHSNMAAIEMHHRAGNLAPTNCMMDAGISSERGSFRAMERVVGYAPKVLRYYGVNPGDLLIAVNAYGINPVTIDTALECKRLGVTLVAITCPGLSVQIEHGAKMRHPSNKNLFELADIVIDDYTPYGEAVVGFEGLPYKVSPVSTITNLFIINALNAMACEIMVANGFQPPVWISGNIVGGDEANQK